MTVQPEEKAQGDLSDMYNFLQEGCKQDRARLCVVVSNDRIKGTGTT